MTSPTSNPSDQLTATESNALKWVLLCKSLGIDPLKSTPDALSHELFSRRSGIAVRPESRG
ncbi:hypothetical protein SEA_SKOG_109 [Gordonia phage Skog]|uniref:Uncharacterized protein n=1 Tax=Gordonia phage Skog TaxID=2704033 RepID=A0A6G6XJH5_9CAUD|nr:hypothetical protein KHQ85_gp109 [Gordonia phage Skog]QIG58261.1 hypothetical protein SEA_SKOG_109 [Gordonia phage Skog]